MSNDITVAHQLPAAIVALQHSTLDQAMELCERAHAIAIPSPAIDEAGCRSALALANPLYRQIEDLEKALEKHRLDRGREIQAIKDRLDAAVKAATGPLKDQRTRLGAKLYQADQDLHRVIAEKQRAAELERQRREAEQRAAAEAARKAELEAKAASEDAARRAKEAAEASAGIDLPPDDEAVVAAQRAADDAAAAAAQAAKAKEQAFDKVFDAEPAPYLAPAPKSAVKGRTEYSLAIDDLAAVPDEVGGVPLWKLDEPTALRLAKELAKHGKTIPGLRLVETQSTSSKGRAGAFGV